MIEFAEQPEALADIAEVRDGQAIVAYNRTEAALTALREKYQGASYDLRTTAGDKAARAARQELVTLRGDLEKKRKELKAPAIDFGKKIDGEAERLRVEILALETPIDSQIKADEKRREDERRAREEAEAARRRVHIDAIAQIAGYVAKATDLPAARIANGITVLEAMDLSGFEEFVQEATETRDRTIAALKALQAKAQSREEEEVRLAAQRAEQQRIAAEQAETARALREQQEAIERQRKELEQREIAAAEAAKPASTPAPAPVAPPAVSSQAPSVVPIRPAPAAPTATLRLGEINSLIAPLSIDAAGLARLGFQPIAVEKAAKLYDAASFPAMVDSLVAQLRSAAAQFEQRAA